jgi:xylan 1,4-beta-xylosidase
MQGDRVPVESSGAVIVDEILRSGVRGKPNIDAIATRSEHGISVLVWNYHDDDLAAANTPVNLALMHLPGGVRTVRVRHYRIDATHSNAWTVWKEIGSPQNPTPEQYARLEAAGQLQMLDAEHSLPVNRGRVSLTFPLPREAVSLIQANW